ncbi:MAG: hypothetical protein ACFFA6_09360 [Promethearchaeota archaeon]
MSDADLIMDKIREELKKGLPSKRKILSYLVDLLNKDKYPSLSDFEVYDIVGDTYKLILNYKLNLKMLFTPVYKDVKKRIKKLYGKEKILKMEQYLEEKYGLRSLEKQKINHQIHKSPVPLSEKLRFCYFSLIPILIVILVFSGYFAFFHSSEIALITFFIIGIIFIIYICTSLDYGW